jgi:DNA-binding CsgD family transcriptional regulator
MACTLEAPCGGQVRVVDQVDERTVYGCLNGHHFANGPMPTLPRPSAAPVALKRARPFAKKRQNAHKLTPEQAQEIRRLRNTGRSSKSLAEQFKVSSSSIWYHCEGPGLCR